MGEAKLKLSATQKLIAQHGYCYFCGGMARATTREHMPPTALFDRSHRPNGLVVPACKECNSDTSTADLIVSIVARWGEDFGSAIASDHARLLARLGKQAPDVLMEWRESSGGVQRKKARRHLLRSGVPVPDNAAFAKIGSATIRQFNLFSQKATLALHFEHTKRPLLRSGRVKSFWRTKEDFARDGIPKGILDILPNYASLRQGAWDESKTFEYRHAANSDEGLFACLLKLRAGIFVVGITVEDQAKLPANEIGWVMPASPPDLLTLPSFTKRT